jgi:xanthine dehydrogenase accessory factor
MRDILSQINHWLSNNDQVALATVVQTWGSSPRRVGAKMALTSEGEMAGSVSGGCVEGAVVEAGLEVLETGEPQLLHFGVADETAWEVGLACGGTIDVFVKSLDPTMYTFYRNAIDDECAAVTTTVIRGPAEHIGRELFLREDGKVFGSLGADLDEIALTAARAAVAAGDSRRGTLPSPASAPIQQASETAHSRPEVEIFIEVLLPPPTLIIVGGVHIAIALVEIAKTLGYRTVVVDPRRWFGSGSRFPQVDRLVHSWPDKALAEIGLTRLTAVALLTHDRKLDDPGLKVALPSQAFYVGALGSRKTQEKRRLRLLEEGLSETDVGRLHGPIGLDIGAQTPEEIALAIMGEVVAARRAGTQKTQMVTE